VKKKYPTVSLVLGSGGARGLAHIGIIRWLEENGYAIRSIAGASMGALIGGIYAAGKLDLYTDWVRVLRKRDVLRLLDFAYSRSGIFSGERVMHQLKGMLGDTRIEDLEISFTAVASDLISGREVWLNRGSLFGAIRASMAIPTVFTPVKKEGRLLVDGGILNPVPIAPTLHDMTDMVIAVCLSGKEETMAPPAEREHAKVRNEKRYQTAITRFIESLQDRFAPDAKEEKINIFDVVSRSIESMKGTIARFKLASYNPDFLIQIPVNACGIFEFYRADEMIALGYDRAAKVLSPPRSSASWHQPDS